MFQDWLDILLSGSYEEALPTLTLASEATGETTGSGRLIWRDRDDLRIQAVTRRVEKPPEKKDDSGEILPGDLIPHSTYLTAFGRTKHQWIVSTNPRSLDGLTTAGSDLIWDFPVAGVCLSNETGSSKHHYLRFLLSPCLETWTRYSHTTVTNGLPEEPRTSSSLNWLRCFPSFGTVSATRQNEDWFEVFVEFKENTPEHDPYEIVGAISRGFSFFLGRQCISRGYEYVAPGKHIRRLDVRQVEAKHGTLRQPLGWQMTLLGNIEPALGPTVDFFLTERGQRVAQYLFLCWDTVDNAFATQQAIACICIEGMLRVAAEVWGPKEEDAKKNESVQKLIAWLDTKPNPIELPDDFVKRVKGMVDGMLNNKLSAKDIQRDWTSRDLLGNTKREFKAWNDTRHPLAHGTVPPASEAQKDLQVRVSHHASIVNLLNKMVLGLIGYEGDYVDHSQRGYPPAPFPKPSEAK